MSQLHGSRSSSSCQVYKMIALLSVLLLILQAVASEKTDKFGGENLYSSQNKGIKFAQSQDLNDGKYEDVNPGLKHQFQKDYERWDEKHRERNKNKDGSNKNFMKINEIEDNEFVDKFNKYGKVFNPEHVDKSFKKKKEVFHEKNADGYRSKSLFYDTDVNYIKNNKKIEKDSELIPGNTAGLQKTMENYQENFQNKNEMYPKRNKKNFYRELKKIDLSTPRFNDPIMMARYIVHFAKSAVLATLSGQNPSKAAPFVCSKAISDGLVNSSSGIPFLYISPKDLCTQDLQKKNRVSILVSLFDTDYCKERNCEQENYPFTKVTLSGEIKRIKHGSEEEIFAKNALFSRHPKMANWPTEHQWYFTKLKIGQITLLDELGAATYVNLKDYLNGEKTEPAK